MPDATKLNSHAEIYEQMQLLWDPRAESDAYATVEQSNKSELNKSASLEFTVLPANIHYNDFHKKRTVVVVYDDDDWIFEGVVTDAPLDFFKRRKVTCADPMSFLCGSVQAPDEKNEINVSTGGSGNKYVPVPSAWYTGASPKGLSWYEQTIETVYAQVEQTDVYHSGITYYIKSGDTYSQWSGGANDWVAVQAGNLKLYLPSGSRPNYTRSNDTSANADKSYYYLSTSNSQNYSGSTTTSAASTKETIIQHIERLLNVHNSQVDPFRKIHMGRMYNSSDSETHEFKAANFRSTWDALKSDILDEFGKYFRIELGEDHELYLDYLELHQLPTVPDAIAPLVEFANNMVNMNESNEDDDDIFTVLVPIGKNNLTVKDVTGHDSPAHDDANHEVDPYIATWGGNKRYVVVSRKAIKRYGYIIKPQSFSDVSDASTLWDRAKKYIQNNYDYHAEYEVKAVDMRFINGTGKRIVVGDKIRIHSQWHGVDTTDLYVISAEHDQSNPENDSYRIGIPTSDREANNRTLTGQSNAAKSKNASNNASNSSATSRLHSILEDYIHVTEWGLEMNSRLKNEVESNDGKYMTRFLQDEEHINLAAQKLFGVDADGRGDTDAGYDKVPKSEYRKVPNDANTPYKNPSEEHWFEKSGNTYTLTNDTTCDPAVVGNKDYYRQRLWTRYSDIDVGPGGIKAVVDGNYERSTYCSSWIKANEDSILAITGHIHVDDNGQVIIDSGSGVRTGHTSERTDVHYQAVPRTQYSNSPVSKHWYERVLNSAGKWTGDGVAESEIMAGATPGSLGRNESKYYKRSTDSTADPQKYYYVRSSTSEEFTAEYGVYDENTLTGGVVARMVNNPSYFPVDKGTIEEAAKEGKIAHNLGWYVYDSSTGNFGLALANDPVHENWSYYTVKNTSEVWTDLRGDHIVIGPAVTPSGDGMSDYAKKNETMQQRVARYLGNNKHLNGTICEISSDVVTVHALFAEYINFENAEGIEIWSQYGEFWSLTANHLSVTQDYGDGDVDAGIAYIDWTVTDILQIGETYFDESDINNQVGNIVMGFGTPTYSGDDVNIPFYTAAENGEYDDNTNILTFTKPASLGSVTWSSGTNTLTAKTVGGKDFLVGEIKNYVPSGQSEAMAMNSAGYLATETTGYSQVYGIYYKYKTILNEEKDGKCMLFKTPRNRYPDAVSTIKTWSNTNKTDDDTVDLDHNETITVYAQYKTEVQYDAESGDDDSKKGDTHKAGITVKSDKAYNTGTNDVGLTNVAQMPNSTSTEAAAYAAKYSSLSGLAYDKVYEYYRTLNGNAFGDKKYFKTPSKGNYRTYAKVGDTEYTSGTIDLGNDGGEVTVYGQRKMDDDSGYTSAAGITVKASASSVSDIGTYDSSGNSKTTMSVGVNGTGYVYGGCKINGTYTGGGYCTVSGPSLSSCTMNYVESKEEGEGDNKTTYYYFKTTKNITSNKTMYY